MIASDLAAGASIACLALTTTPAIMLAIALVSAAAQAPFFSASTASVPNLVQADEIAWANGTVAVGRNAGQVLGPVLGGTLVGVIDPAGVFLLNAACFAASAALVFTVRGRFSDRRDPESDEHRGVRAGFRFLLADRVLRLITLAWVVLLAGVGPILVAELPLARSFGEGSTGYGLLAGSWGAGAIAGSFLGQRLGSRRERIAMIASALGMATGFAVIGVASWFVMVLFGMAFAGVAEGAGSVAEQGIVQRRTPDAVRSRVIAASEAALLIAFAASFAVAAPIIHVFGVQGTYVIAAAASVAAAAILVPAMRGLVVAAEVDGDVEPRSASPRAPGDPEADGTEVPAQEIRAVGR
jgi:predicted MFS family arabinose efflux permease